MILDGRRRKVAISELMGTLLMIGITLIAGVALYGWVATQAGVSENAYGKQVSNNVNYLNEHFVPVTQSFGAGSSTCVSNGGKCTSAAFWLYNNGGLGFTLNSIQIASSNATNPLNMLFYSVSQSGCSTGTQNCGWVYYNPTSGATLCTDTNNNSTVNTFNGFYNSSPKGSSYADVPGALPQQQLSSRAYLISMPNAGTFTGCGSVGQTYLFNGETYTFTFNGLYGNSVPIAVTVRG